MLVPPDLPYPFPPNRHDSLLLTFFLFKYCNSVWIFISICFIYFIKKEFLFEQKKKIKSSKKNEGMKSTSSKQQTVPLKKCKRKNKKGKKKPPSRQNVVDRGNGGYHYYKYQRIPTFFKNQIFTRHKARLAKRCEYAACIARWENSCCTFFCAQAPNSFLSC